MQSHKTLAVSLTKRAKKDVNKMTTEENSKDLPYIESELKDLYTFKIDFTDEDYYTSNHVKTLKPNTDINFEIYQNNKVKGLFKLNIEELINLLKDKTRTLTTRSEEAILRYGESHREEFARFLK
jgi:hypothetical protein